MTSTTETDRLRAQLEAIAAGANDAVRCRFDSHIWDVRTANLDAARRMMELLAPTGDPLSYYGPDLEPQWLWRWDVPGGPLVNLTYESAPAEGIRWLPTYVNYQTGRRVGLGVDGELVSFLTRDDARAALTATLEELGVVPIQGHDRVVPTLLS